MSVLKLLENNKGTVSSALGKSLANRILAGDKGILGEVVRLSCFHAADEDARSIRSGAAKAVELAAEKKPALIAPLLERLLPALAVPEPQTRWMIIRTMGFCASLNGKTAEKAVPFAEKYIANKEGLCLTSSADLFWGDFGSVSARNARIAFSGLKKSADTAIRNEQDWLMEAFMKIAGFVGRREQDFILAFARRHEKSARKSTAARAERIRKMIDNCRKTRKIR